MRILHVTKKYPNAIGGDAVCVFYLEREQRKAGHEVIIFTTNCRDIITKGNVYKFGLADNSYNWDRVTVKRIISLFLFFLRSFSALKKIKPDIIHSHSADLGFLIALWAFMFHIPVFVTCHTINFPYSNISVIKRFPEWFLLKFGLFNRIISTDAQSMSYFNAYGIKNCEYLSMLGVDVEGFATIPMRVISAKNSYPKCMFIGRLDPLKGVDVLIEALRHVREQGVNLNLWIIGDGPYRQVLQNMVKDAHLDDCVRFYHAITSRRRLIKMYHLVDILALPSFMETFSLVVLEAWAAGVAVIATKVGVLSSVGKDRENVFFVERQDADSLALALLALVRDETLRLKIARNGMECAKSRFSWSRAAENLEHFYTKYAH